MQHPMALLTNLDVFKHFQQQRSAERVELLTGLLRMCVPLEISFLSAVIDEIMHREVRELKSIQDQAVKANKREELMKLDPTDVLVVQRLCVYTALLSSNNYLCADRIFTLVKAINELQLSSGSSSNAGNAMANEDKQQDSYSTDLLDSVCSRWRAGKESELENFLLLCALARAHPAFKFADKRILGDYIDATSDVVHLSHATLTDVNNNNQTDSRAQADYLAPDLLTVDSNSALVTEQRDTDTTDQDWKMDGAANSDLGCDTSDTNTTVVQHKNEDEKSTCDPRDDTSLAAALRVQTNLCCQLTKDRFDITLASCEYRQAIDWSITLRISWCGDTPSAPHSTTLDSKRVVYFVTRTRKHFHDMLSKLDCEWLGWLHESRDAAPSGTATAVCVTSASHSRRIDLARVYETSIPSAQVFSHHQLSRVCDHASLRSVLTEFIQSIGQIPACIVKEVLIRDCSLTANCGAPTNDYVDGLQSAACAAQANCASEYGLQPNNQQRQQAAFVRPSAVAYSGVPLTAYPHNAVANNCPTSFADCEQRDAPNGAYCFSVADSTRYRVNGNAQAYRLVSSYNHLVPFGNMSPGTFVQTGLAQSTLGAYNAYQPGAVPYQQAYQNAYANVYQAAYTGQLQPSATSAVQPNMYGPHTPTHMPYRVNAAQQQPYNANVANLPHNYVPATPAPNWSPSQLPQHQQQQQQQQSCTCFDCQARYRSTPETYGAAQGQMPTVLIATAAGVQTNSVPYPCSSYSYVAQPNAIHGDSMPASVCTPPASVGAATGPRQNANPNQYSAMLQNLHQLTLCTAQMQPQNTGQTVDIVHFAESVAKANDAEVNDSANQSAATAASNTYSDDVTSQFVALAQQLAVAAGHNASHVCSPSTTVECTNMNNNNNSAIMSPNHPLGTCSNSDSAKMQLKPHSHSNADGTSVCSQPSTSTESTIIVPPTNASESTPLNTTQTVICSSSNYYSTSSSQTSSTSSFVSIVDCNNQQNDADSETADMTPTSNQHALVTTSGQVESDFTAGSADDAHGDSASQSQTSASDNDAAADYVSGLSRWFKTLRLHKYFERVATLSFDRLLALNDEQLRELGFTTGAARKFIAARQALDVLLRSGELARGCFPRAPNPSTSNSQVATTSSSSSASLDSRRSASTRRKEQRSAPGAASCEQDSNADAFVSDSVAERDVAAENDARRGDPAIRRSALSTSSSPAVFAAPTRHQSYQRRGSLSYRSYAHPQSHRAHRASSAADFYMSVFPPDNFPLNTFGLAGGVGMNDIGMMDGAFPPGGLNPVTFGAMNDAAFGSGVSGAIPLSPLGVPANANVYPIGLPPGMHMNALGFGMMHDPLLNAAAAAPFQSPNAPPSQLVTCVNQILNAGSKSQPLFLAFVTR